jgi:hypothetical protein
MFRKIQIIARILTTFGLYVIMPAIILFVLNKPRIEKYNYYC